ncbi:SRR1-like protein [Melopsittacus undulatus]|uniref:SRR1-like domain-containing protein n=1 Tax=Melopsittacus undulatus TaxID=13146 RepID=A0A8C6J0F8_MELUD|nr:SRR1-like protein [Melopsittacus undulatus]
MAAMGGWRPAGGRWRRRGRAAEEAADGDGSAVLRRLREARDDLLSSGFWAASAGAVREPLGRSAEPPARCVCYGLGRFGACPAARYQLAFLLLLLEELRVSPGQCSLFDPAFSPREEAALRQLGMRLLPENEEGKHDVEGSATVFYMVHCGKALYNNLLWRNWSAEALSKMVIIGNSFRGMEERLLSKVLERDYSYIAKVLKVTEEAALPTHPRYLDTFNDTSVHWFPPQKLQEISPEVWDFLEEPMYQDCEDLEIIRRKDGAEWSCPAAAKA